ncbi:universal stress protein [Exiguobacterium sp. RIT594]|uniref:universal stress protein n=1 Tax=Exiguobacterium sp. RIT594 TaxID=2282449 RepID=UPI000DF85AB5|nr:universal stress protein [Exiguobacterium sp. RIT594]RDB34226.1 universal stress protein [Exiguobacterium sp. RIT594]
MYPHILLAVDGSEHSIRATEEAIKIATLSSQSKIEVVFVADFSKAKDDVLHAEGAAGIEVARRKKLAPVEEKLEAADVSYYVTILRGEPGPTIVEHANQKQVDLTIIGSRGLNSLQEMMLGSVSHKIAKRVKCPVLIVK